MKMTWSCVVEGDPKEVSSFIKFFPAALTNFQTTEEDAVAEIEAQTDEVQSEEVEAQVEPTQETQETQEVEAEESNPPQAAYQPPIKDRIVTFLEGRSRAKLNEVARGIGAAPASVARPLRNLQEEGIVRKIGRKRSNNAYRLQKPTSNQATSNQSASTSEGKITNIEALRRGKSQWDNFLPILNALVDRPDSTVRQLRESTGISEDILEDRLVELQKLKLVKENNGEFEVRSATRSNQLERPKGVKLRDLVTEAVRANPGETSKQIACRLGASYGEVARRLADLKKSTLDSYGHNKTTARWYVRKEVLETV